MGTIVARDRDMPELMTKHPEVTKTVLESAGAVCGGEQERTILKQCPPASFCKLPGGEVCVYGVDEASAMSQISPRDLAAYACPEKQEGGSCGFGVAEHRAGAELLALFGMLAVRRWIRAERRLIPKTQETSWHA